MVNILLIIDKLNNVIVTAHRRPIRCLALNYSGTMLATASQTGAKIKIFDTMTGHQLQELRRGAKRAEIIHITFHISSMFIACTSNKEAVHIFELFNANHSMEDKKSFDKEFPKDEIGYPNNTITLNPLTKNKVAKLAGAVSWIINYFKSQWSFARIKLPAKWKYCAFANGNDFVIITSDLKLCEYKIPDLGGYCTLKDIKKMQFRNKN